MKTKTVLVITGAIELVKKGAENYTRKIPGGNIRITELQKIVLLGTAYILRRTEIYPSTNPATYNCPIGPWTELGTISGKSTIMMIIIILIIILIIV